MRGESVVLQPRSSAFCSSRPWPTASSASPPGLHSAPRLVRLGLHFRASHIRITGLASQQKNASSYYGIRRPEASFTSKVVSTSASAAPLAITLLAPLLLLTPAASALQIHQEPSNALSLPTWAIHVSSTVEWAIAIGLMWRYADVTGNQRWKGMSWGMMPLFASALCACTWHFFYNSPDLEFLVALQAGLTVVGNFTCWLAAYRIYQGTKSAAPL